MISIIISSANQKLLSAVIANIESTIGVPFEIIPFDNSDGAKGICEIYNLGAAAARYDILCYMHEDLDIKTYNWGKFVLEDFSKNEKLGVIGVVGSSYKSFVPSGWGAESYESDLIFYNYIQRYKHEDKPNMVAYSNVNDVEIQPVVVVDGMWFCTRKEIALTYKFDEKTFKRFHCYDLDYCLQVGLYYDIAVTFRVLIEHFSEGSYSKEWFDETLKLQDKWESTLPRSVEPISPIIAGLIEKRGYKRILYRLVSLGYPLSYILNFLNTFRKKTRMPFKFYVKLRYYLFSFWYLKKTLD
ncbi:MAG: hypothetical protein EOO88_28480 [Pedobacter sp.]|nr:MAG: hypothetical protein EOO88_28480 [Pedobacter sp.]